MLKLNKALEGIKQGANLWFKRNCAALTSTSVGFVASLTEPNLYIHQELPIMVAVFVDDIIAGHDKASRGTYLKINDMYAKLIKIGIEIQDRHTITLSQKDYIKELAVRYQGKVIESYSATGPLRKSVEEFDRLELGNDNSVDKVDVK